MVNRVLTSPYLWWFDVFSVEGPRPHKKVLAYQDMATTAPSGVAQGAGSAPAGSAERSPFIRTTELLAPYQPAKPLITLSLGEPQHPVPDFVGPVLAKHTAEFGRYPIAKGTDAFRKAVSGWLSRRYKLPRPLDPETEVLVLNGSREGLFSVLFPFMPETKAGARPIVAMPNPFYQCYAAAALGSGAEPLYVPALKENGFLPDFAGLPGAILERLAAVYICSPSNPEGAVADEAYWTRLFARVVGPKGHVYGIWPEPYVDRFGRLHGNIEALLDLARGRIHPERILQL